MPLHLVAITLQLLEPFHSLGRALRIRTTRSYSVVSTVIQLQLIQHVVSKARSVDDGSRMGFPSSPAEHLSCSKVAGFQALQQIWDTHVGVSSPRDSRSRSQEQCDGNWSVPGIAFSFLVQL